MQFNLPSQYEPRNTGTVLSAVYAELSPQPRKTCPRIWTYFTFIGQVSHTTDIPYLSGNASINWLELLHVAFQLKVLHQQKQMQLVTVVRAYPVQYGMQVIISDFLQKTPPISSISRTRWSWSSKVMMRDIDKVIQSELSQTVQT